MKDKFEKYFFLKGSVNLENKMNNLQQLFHKLLHWGVEGKLQHILEISNLNMEFGV
jgi:hypothetical protein